MEIGKAKAKQTGVPLNQPYKSELDMFMSNFCLNRASFVLFFSFSLHFSTVLASRRRFGLEARQASKQPTHKRTK